MDEHPFIDDAILERFFVTDPRFVAATALATVWRVRRVGGGEAALKVYRNADMRNEAAAAAWLEAQAGCGSVEFYGRSGAALLMEWLAGPSLGDVARRGDDQLAAAELVEVARRVHAGAHPLYGGLTDLADWCHALVVLRCAPECCEQLKTGVGQAQGLLQQLLAGTDEQRPLHGDLHHDNIRLGPRGYTAFDPKGIKGDRAFELANAFRHPADLTKTVRDPVRIRYLAAVWSRSFDVDEKRLLQRAAVKCALSMAWRNGPDLSDDAESDLLLLLLDAALQVP